MHMTSIHPLTTLRSPQVGSSQMARTVQFGRGKKKEETEADVVIRIPKRSIKDYAKATWQAFVKDGLSFRGLAGDSIGIGLVGLAALVIPGAQLTIPFLPFWYLVGIFFRTAGAINKYLPPKQPAPTR
jgi:hypothetical protein